MCTIVLHFLDILVSASNRRLQQCSKDDPMTEAEDTLPQRFTTQKTVLTWASLEDFWSLTRVNEQFFFQYHIPAVVSEASVDDFLEVGLRRGFPSVNIVVDSPGLSNGF